MEYHVQRSLLPDPARLEMERRAVEAAVSNGATSVEAIAERAKLFPVEVEKHLDFLGLADKL